MLVGATGRRELHPQRRRGRRQFPGLDDLGISQTRHADQQSVSSPRATLQGQGRRRAPISHKNDAADLSARAAATRSRGSGDGVGGSIVDGRRYWLRSSARPLRHPGSFVFCFVVRRTELRAHHSGASLPARKCQIHPQQSATVTQSRQHTRKRSARTRQTATGTCAAQSRRLLDIRQTAAISTCTSLPTEHGFIVARRFGGCRWCSYSRWFCARRLTVMFSSHRSKRLGSGSTDAPFLEDELLVETRSGRTTPSFSAPMSTTGGGGPSTPASVRARPRRRPKAVREGRGDLWALVERALL